MPVLQTSVAGVEVLRGRRYCESLEAHAPLREALQGAAAGRFPLFVLFPGPDARDLQEAAAEMHTRSDSSSGFGKAQQPCGCAAITAAQHPEPLLGEGVQDVGQQCEPGQCSCGDPLYALLVLDGTWPQASSRCLAWKPSHALPCLNAVDSAPPWGLVRRSPPGRPLLCPVQAKEMYNAVTPAVLLPAGPGVCVQLPSGQPRTTPPEQRQGASEPAAAEPHGMHAAGGGQRLEEQGVPPQDSPLLLRVEPEEGCMSTCEAAARALALLEPHGAAVHAAIMRPLTRLVDIQVLEFRGCAAGILMLCHGTACSWVRCLGVTRSAWPADWQTHVGAASADRPKPATWRCRLAGTQRLRNACRAMEAIASRDRQRGARHGHGELALWGPATGGLVAARRQNETQARRCHCQFFSHTHTVGLCRQSTARI